MSDSDIDSAFDLLIVIIALIYSIVGSYPELFWQSTPDLSLEIITMRMTVLPLIVLTLLWLASKLISNKNGQVLLKFVAWMTAFTMVVLMLILYMESLKFIKLSELSNISPHMAGALTILEIFISPLIIYMIIFPKYKEKYPDVPFFRGKVWSVVSYVLYLLVLGTIIFMTSTNYAAW